MKYIPGTVAAVLVTSFTIVLAYAVGHDIGLTSRHYHPKCESEIHTERLISTSRTDNGIRAKLWLCPACGLYVCVEPKNSLDGNRYIFPPFTDPKMKNAGLTFTIE